MILQPNTTMLGQYHRHRVLQAICERFAEAADEPMNLADFVGACLRAGYRHRGKRSLSQVVHMVLRRLVDEDVLDFDEETRFYSIKRRHRNAC
jgi:hypothetical protein